MQKISLIKRITTNVRHFFWWSAGAVRSVLEKCPTEQVKFSSIGILIVFISILASISFAFFLTMTFEIPFSTAIPFGFVWGAMIFCLDRVLLTSYRKGETSNISIFQRFVLTIAIAVLIGEPMLLYFFRNEINLELTRRGVTVAIETRRTAEEQFKPEVENIKNENVQIQAQADQLKKERDEKEQAMIGETEGIVGSGVKGFGQAAKQKETAFKEADAKYNEFKREAASNVSKNQSRLEEIKRQIDNDVKVVEENYSKSKGGVLARHEALFALVKKDAGAALVYIPLFIIMLLLETLPLSIKVFSKKGVYDDTLATEENQRKSDLTKQSDYEAKQKDDFRESSAKLEAKLNEAVLEDKISELQDKDLVTLAEQIKKELLTSIEESRLKSKMAAFNEVEFGDEILIEVIDYQEAEFVCQLPKQNRKMFSLKTLAADIDRIGKKISESVGEKVRFAKAFSSKMTEISANLPLLVQLEKDNKLILEFEPTGEPI